MSRMREMRLATKILTLGGVGVAAVILAGCAGSQPRQPVKAGVGPFLQAYLVDGVVRESKPEEEAVVIQHGEIPGYKPAATTPFPVKNLAELDGLQPGDKVSFRLLVTGTNSWLDQIQVIEASGRPAPVSSTPR